MFLINSFKCAKGNQMTSNDIRKTCKVTNVKIFAEKQEKAITKIKWFRTLKNQLPLLEMTQLEDIVIFCSSLVSLLCSLTGK